MKKIKERINRYFDTLNARWQALPEHKQNRYVLYFFAGYLLLTLVVILSPYFNEGKALKHIQSTLPESPAAVADSLLKTLKHKFYERK
jgi:hypothetical protein